MSTQPGGTIDDVGMRWKLAHIHVPWQSMDGVLDDATSGIPASLGVGTPTTAEIVAAAETAGIKLDALDEVYFSLPIQAFNDFDLDEDLRGQIIGSFTDAGAVANVDFTLIAKGVVDAVPISDAKVSPDATVTFPALSGAAGGQIFKTAIIPFDARGTFKADDRILFAVTLAAKGTATADKVFLTDVMLYGSRQACNENGREVS